MTPSVGRVVHYVSEGSPWLADGTQKYPSKCRAAMITDTVHLGSSTNQEDDFGVSLFVINPTGVFLREGCQYDGAAGQPGTWHWPERVE